MIRYLNYKRKEILVYFLLIISIEVIFSLFHLDKKALVYPLILWLFIGIVYLLLDYSSNKQKLDKWILDEETNIKPSSIMEDAYIQKIEKLEDELIQVKNKSIQREQNQMDYYTLWVHQIKTPIASMRLNLQNEDSIQSRQLLIELNRIEQYTNMVLTYLRLDSSSTDYVFQKVDLDQIMKDVIRKFSSEFINRKLSLDYLLNSYEVLTDEKWLAFVLEQILSNALKYTRSGKITISQSDTILCIQDTGIGIQKEDLARVFEKGYTGLNGRLDKKASGLGLYLCKRICDNLHHKIWIESEIGKGTCVYIQFLDKKVGIE